MPKLAANLTMMFNEVSFLDRFEAAAAAGFTAVEYMFPYDYDAQLLKDDTRPTWPHAGTSQPAGRELGRRRPRHRMPARPR